MCVTTVPAVPEDNRWQCSTPYIHTSEVKIQELIRLSKVGSQKAAAIFEKTGRGGFVFELFLGGGSLGYVDSILYFYFLFPSRFALNFCFEVRSSFVEFVELWSIIFFDICGKCWLILYMHMS